MKICLPANFVSQPFSTKADNAYLLWQVFWLEAQLTCLPVAIAPQWPVE